MSHRQIALCWFGTGRCLSPRRPGPQPQAQWKACILVCWHQHGLVCKHNPQGASQGIVVVSRPAASSMASKLTRSDSNFYRRFGDPMALAWPSPALVCACTITSRRSASSPSPNLVCATFNRSRPANWLPANWVRARVNEFRTSDSTHSCGRDVTGAFSFIKKNRPSVGVVALLALLTNEFLRRAP